MDLVLVPLTLLVEDEVFGGVQPESLERPKKRCRVKGPEEASSQPHYVSMDVGVRGQPTTMKLYLEEQDDIGDASVPFWPIPRVEDGAVLELHYIDVEGPAAWKLVGEKAGAAQSRKLGKGMAVQARMPVLRNPAPIAAGVRLTARAAWE